MRFGISWDAAPAEDVSKSWRAMVAEAVAADGLGIDSVWVHHEATGDGAVTAPAAVLSYLSSKTTSIQLCVGGRRVGRGSPVRIAEEIAVLDTFSAGRAGLSFASPIRQGVSADELQEVVELTLAAWRLEDFRYRGDHVRFPSHTPDDAPRGTSTPGPDEPWRPQWEWGAATPDFLAVTPKPVQSQPALSVELDEELISWAAAAGVSPFVGADVPTEAAVDLLTRYQDARARVHALPWGVGPVLERRMNLDGEGDGCALGGNAAELAEQIRRIARRTDVSHLVWRRTQKQRGRSDQLFKAASELHPLLQA